MLRHTVIRGAYSVMFYDCLGCSHRNNANWRIVGGPALIFMARALLRGARGQALDGPPTDLSACQSILFGLSLRRGSKAVLL